MKYAKLITIISAALCLLAGVATASTNLTVQFEKSPLFNEANVLPGDGTTRFIKVTNNTTAANKIAVIAENFPTPTPSDDLSRALDITISKGGVDLWGGASATGHKTLFDFYQAGEIVLADIAAGQSQQYDFTLALSTDKGDLPVSDTTWQAKKTNFDIAIGFTGQINPPCTGPNCGGCTGPNCGGCVGPNCNYTPPGCTGPGCGGGPGSGCELKIIEVPITSVKASGITYTTAKILWLTNCKSTSQVLYSPSNKSHNFDLTKTNYGYDKQTVKDMAYVESHEMPLKDLKACTTYYFRVVSTNPKEAISKEYSFMTPCVEGTSTITTNDYRSYGEPDTLKAVAGAATAAPKCEPNPECKGDACECPAPKALAILGFRLDSCSSYDPLPWILLILTVVFAIYELNRRDHWRRLLKKLNTQKGERKLNWNFFLKSLAWPVIVIVILLLLQFICNNIPWWFWLIILIALAIYGRIRYSKLYYQLDAKQAQEYSKRQSKLV